MVSVKTKWLSSGLSLSQLGETFSLAGLGKKIPHFMILPPSNMSQ